MRLKLSTQEQVKKQSQIVTALRFPLSVLVVFIHVLPFTVPQVEPEASGEFVYYLVSSFISHHWSASIVPAFFIFSGYYLFYGRTESVTSPLGYRRELGKRTRTLLLPYLFWNFFNAFAILAKEWLGRTIGIGADPSAWDSITRFDVLSWLTTPIDFPLWYVRDLLIMSLVYPLFYWAYRYVGKAMYAVLSLAYLFGGLADLSWIPMTATFFFGLGACMGMGEVYLLALARQIYPLTAVSFLILTPMSVFGYGNRYLSLINIALGVFFLLHSFALLFESWPRFKDFCLRMAPTSFFIYALHLIYIESWLKGFFASTSLNDSGWGKLLAYFLIPTITVLICLGIYYSLRRLFPKMLSIICGGRN